MLLLLRIENFALIDTLELEFGPGLNVLTGETGAGKSIILDALDAALGGKVSSRVIRTGKERALVEATFEVNSAVAEWARAQEIDLLDGSLLVASRELVASPTGLRSRSRLNGILVNRQIMEQLRERLVEITAQGQTVILGQPARQREWLDAFAGSSVSAQRQAVAAAFAAYQKASHALKMRRQSEQQRLQRLDLLEYQVKELSAANLSDPDELAQQEAEQQRLSHIVDLQQQSYQVYQALYENETGGEAAADLLGQAEATLRNMVRYDSQLQPILDLVSSALTEVMEAGRQMSSYASSLEADPERLQEVEERIRELKRICRKYGPSLPDAIAYYERIQTELEQLTTEGESLEILEKAEQEAQARLINACAELTKLRTAAARQLEERLIAELKPLAMEKVQFRVEITPAPPTSVGADKIIFQFSPNPGEPLQALSETASGGEMNRFLLALKACFALVDDTASLVFDEIDAGVSGRVAQAIAQKLYQLSHRHQVLCVTHQPMIAAMADRHFHVIKQVVSEESELVRAGDFYPNSSQRTVVRVTQLDERQRREELATLAGGQKASSAIAWANSLLLQASNMRNSIQLSDSHLSDSNNAQQ
ncbi:MAG: DNA repair protein RecN [Oscillatoriaceae bacterium SKW80]|nr:DNA repair protein RecN [Oscillatoriaceae bacterium SKYG93]MCX8120640.1 DNA repair protein RecN [Oscillatoriaceae bacterium SKW80]MDW8453821.1 DNA repair protein RecN [Oscillatoriaceae cyanobacterium SKYGB_i_bin93]HIK27052.1 DNA repair protein RecN [Oscillatoriaceae cyanobacterium M7585_C2015_266]